MFLEHSNFPAFSLPERCSQTDKFPKNCLHSRISIMCECAQIAFCFPSRRPVFASRPSKVYFSGCQFQNRTYNSSLETRKKFRSWFHFVIYILEQKNYAGVFLTRVFLLKLLWATDHSAQCIIAQGNRACLAEMPRGFSTQADKPAPW